MTHPAQWWHRLPDGRLQCDLCPRECRLHDGQRGLCFVRQRQADTMVLDTYGRSSGFCLDPVEKKPLHHFYPGSSILSFGTAGCNLSCRFCQNWDISKSRDVDKLGQAVGPQALAQACVQLKTPMVAFTYNDPIIFAEYAIDVAQACHAEGIKTVAVTAGFVHAQPRQAFFAHMDAANVDLKAFTQEFYHQWCSGDLRNVLDTLVYIRHETSCWLEITTLLIPGANDSAAEIQALSEWVYRELGPHVPLHFTAFHPDYKMQDRPRTPPQTLSMARRVALDAGLHHVYTGNVHDQEGGTTRCPACQSVLITRDWHLVTAYCLQRGHCPSCGQALAGHFRQDDTPWQPFGRKRIPVRLQRADAAAGLAQ